MAGPGLEQPRKETARHRNFSFCDCGPLPSAHLGSRERAGIPPTKEHVPCLLLGVLAAPEPHLSLQALSTSADIRACSQASPSPSPDRARLLGVQVLVPALATQPPAHHCPSLSLSLLCDTGLQPHLVRVSGLNALTGSTVGMWVSTGGVGLKGSGWVRFLYDPQFSKCGPGNL